MEHVQAMLARIAALDGRRLLGQPSLVLLGAFFHDVVYDPKAKDNEAQSASMWRSFAEAEAGLLTPVQIETVFDFIMRTASHMQGPAHGDLAHFLDADLLILAAPPAAYAEYARQVRLEYAHVPTAQFAAARSEILSTFIAADRIYFTPEAADEYEAVARANLTAEIDRLRRRLPA